MDCTWRRERKSLWQSLKVIKDSNNKLIRIEWSVDRSIFLDKNQNKISFTAEFLKKHIQ